VCCRTVHVVSGLLSQSFWPGSAQELRFLVLTSLKSDVVKPYCVLAPTTSMMCCAPFTPSQNRKKKQRAPLYSPVFAQQHSALRSSEQQLLLTMSELTEKHSRKPGWAHMHRSFA
jgi:hypothetical protein